MAGRAVNLTRSVKASSLGTHHIGREFVALGTLQQVRIERDVIVLVTDGEDWCVTPSAQLDYYLTDEELEAPSRRARAWHQQNPDNGYQRPGWLGTL